MLPWLTALATLGRTGLLHPQESESRETKSLDGLWRFRADHRAEGLLQQWQSSGLPEPTMPMAVPSSYNELSQDAALRDHVGLVWYERETFLPSHWLARRTVLFVGSANHHAVVWLNGQRLGEHEGGHLPFHLPLAGVSAVNFRGSNRLTIALNNTLTRTTIPPGFVQVRLSDMWRLVDVRREFCCRRRASGPSSLRSLRSCVCARPATVARARAPCR